MKAFRFVALLGILATISPAAAQTPPSIAGEWTASITTPGGVRESQMVFEVRGDTVTGTVKRPTGDVRLKGTLKGTALRFSYTIDYNGNGLVMTITATVSGDTMKGRVDFGGNGDDEFSAARTKK